MLYQPCDINDEISSIYKEIKTEALIEIKLDEILQWKSN